MGMDLGSFRGRWVSGAGMEEDRESKVVDWHGGDSHVFVKGESSMRVLALGDAAEEVVGGEDVGKLDLEVYGVEVGRRWRGRDGAGGEEVAHGGAAGGEAEGDEVGVGLEDLGEGRGRREEGERGKGGSRSIARDWWRVEVMAK